MNVRRLGGNWDRREPRSYKDFLSSQKILGDVLREKWREAGEEVFEMRFILSLLKYHVNYVEENFDKVEADPERFKQHLRRANRAVISIVDRIEYTDDELYGRGDEPCSPTE